MWSITTVDSLISYIQLYASEYFKNIKKIINLETEIQFTTKNFEDIFLNIILKENKL